MAGAEIEHLTRLLAVLPGLGPRSARRTALHLLKRRETVLNPLIEAMTAVATVVKKCSICGNLDSRDPCSICMDARRDPHVVCVVAGVEDVWALERAATFTGRYHVLGSLLSPLDGIGPDDLEVASLIERAQDGVAQEVILALPVTVDGQATAHYLTDQLQGCGAVISSLAHGAPVGGELSYLDDGTLRQALRGRHPV